VLLNRQFTMKLSEMATDLNSNGGLTEEL
jgi:hypothetical protein